MKHPFSRYYRASCDYSSAGTIDPTDGVVGQASPSFLTIIKPPNTSSLADEFDRFVTTVTVCTHPDLAVSTPEAAAVLKRLRSWERFGRHGDPPQVTSCRGLGSAIVTMPGQVVPPDLHDDLLGFDEKLRAAVQGYNASLQPRPPATLPGSKVLVVPDMIANLVPEAKRLWRRLDATMVARPPLSDGQRDVWEALEGRALTGKQLHKRLGVPEDSIRQHVRAMKKAGYEVRNARNLGGYYRPDAPPPM